MDDIPERYEVRHDDDAREPKLTCNDCWDAYADLDENPGYLCDIDDGDSLRVLASVAGSHEMAVHA